MSKTMMLVHGACVTTDCLTSFHDFFEARAYRVRRSGVAISGVEELRRSPDPRLAKMTIKGFVDHFEKQIRASTCDQLDQG